MTFPLVSPLGDEFEYAQITAQKYDAAGGEPNDWRLWITLEAPGAEVKAAFSGVLSAHPPDELPPDRIPVKVADADGALRYLDYDGLLTPLTGVHPSETRLYLVPFAGEPAQSLGVTLATAGLGRELRYVYYDNVDYESLRALAAIEQAVRPDLTSYTVDQVLELFLGGEITIAVDQGTGIGTVSPADSGRLGVGVQTDVGLVCPIAFWNAVQPGAVFADQVGTNWPFLTASNALTSSSSSLYPMPVLHHARMAYIEFEANWRTAGDSQKALYWQRLLGRYGTATGPAFSLDTRDLANVFQLEAVVEFFLAYAAPGTSDTPVPSSATTIVDLASWGPGNEWHFVMIDPFAMISLNGAMLGPNYRIDPYVDSTGASFGPDRYDAVLFVVFRGAIERWHRWTSYTSHVWVADPVGKSSIKGNRRYSLTSHRADTVSAINYAFWIYEDPVAHSCPGLCYFDPGTPVDANGKTTVMAHVGFTTTATVSMNYNGSEGCLTSPSFMRMRDQVLDLLKSASPSTWNTNLDKLHGKSLIGSIEVYNSATYDWHLWLNDPVGSGWNDVIQGAFWLVRIDEPTRK